jgi:hypothetical protein
MREEDITENSVQAFDDNSITDISGNVKNYDSYYGYILLDELITRIQFRVGKTRLLGMDLIPRYHVDIDFVTRPNRPFELTKQTIVNSDQ